MKLIRLRLDNFRQHRDTEVEFRDGMTAIVGTNGAGKTTLLEAITYAMYGQQRKTKETIKFYWSESKTKFKVTLDFEFDGRRYRVERSNSDAMLADVTEGIGVRASGLREVTAACEKLISLSYEQFTNSFCAEQKELAFLNFKNNAARQDEVARMLGFDRLKAAAALAKERNRELRGKIDTLDRSLGNLEDLQRRKKEAETKLAEIEAALKASQSRQKEIEQELKPAQKSKAEAERWLALTSELGAIGANASGLKDSVKLTEHALEEARKDAEEWRSLGPIELEYKQTEQESQELEELREADRRRETLSTEADRLAKEVERLEHELKALNLPDVAGVRKTLEETTAAVSSIEKELRTEEQAWHKAKADAQASYAAADTRLKQAREMLERGEAMAAAGVCPECGQPTSNGYASILDKRRTEVREREADLEEEQKQADIVREKPKDIEQSEARLSDAKERYSLAQSALSHASSLEAQAKLLKGQRDKQGAELDSVRKELTAIPSRYNAQRHAAVKARLEQLRPSHERALRLAGSEEKLTQADKKAGEAKANYEAAKAKYRQIEAERNALPFKDEAGAHAAVGLCQSLLQQLAAVESALQQSDEVKRFAQRELDQASAAIAEYKVRAEELKESRASLALHEHAARELLNLREALNKSIRPDLESRASENLSLLTNGRYPVLELSDAFEATLVEDEISKSVISGGEEDVVALSLRLALSELIQERQGRPMSLLILDEVFGSLDADRRQSVLERLSSIKGRFNQILVISHIEEINQVADQCIYLTRDPETRATVVSDAPPLEQELLAAAF